MSDPEYSGGYTVPKDMAIQLIGMSDGDIAAFNRRAFARMRAMGDGTFDCRRVQLPNGKIKLVGDAIEDGDISAEFSELWEGLSLTGDECFRVQRQGGQEISHVIKDGHLRIRALMLVPDAPVMTAAKRKACEALDKGAFW